MEKPGPHEFEANIELLDIFADDQRHHQTSTFNVILLFLTANAGLCAALEFMAKAVGHVGVGLIGLASVLISFLSALGPRKMWYRSMTKGYTVQEELKKVGVKLYANPFGSTPARGGLRTTHLVHCTVAVLWMFYIWRHATLSELWHALADGTVAIH